MRTFIFFLLLCPLFCKAQTDTIYLSKSWKRCSRDTAFYYRVISSKTDSGYLVTDRYKSTNQVKMLGYSLKSDTVIENGHFIFYKENSEISEEGDYVNGKRHGGWTYYYQDTNAIWTTCTYTNDKIDRKLLSYYKNGKLKRKAHYFEGEFLSGKCYAEDSTEIAYTPFRLLPEFNGNYSQFIAQNIRYPEYARMYNIEGRVYLRFMIDEMGHVEDVKVIKSVDPLLDKEAIRVVKKMPAWLPSMRDDKPTETWFTLPINFKLQ